MDDTPDEEVLRHGIWGGIQGRRDRGIEKEKVPDWVCPTYSHRSRQEGSSFGESFRPDPYPGRDLGVVVGTIPSPVSSTSPPPFSSSTVWNGRDPRPRLSVDRSPSERRRGYECPQAPRPPLLKCDCRTTPTFSPFVSIGTP